MIEPQRDARTPPSAAVIAAVWKSIDDTVRILEKLARMLGPLHRDVELSGLAAMLLARRAKPFYLVPAEFVGENLEVAEFVPIPGIPNGPLCQVLRPGVFVLSSGLEAGSVRQYGDLAAQNGVQAASVAAPAAAAALWESMPDDAWDTALACFGAARQAWFALEHAQQLVRAEFDAIDQVLAQAEAPSPTVAGSDGELQFLARLNEHLSELIDQERERSRDREGQQRNFELVSRRLVTAIDVGAIVATERRSAIDRYRPRLLHKLIGKVQIDMRLNDAAINHLVDAMGKAAQQTVQDQIRRLVRSITKLGSGEIERSFGRSAQDMVHAPRDLTRHARLIHESVAGSGREFNFKLERLGAINRIMRARMEIAGIFMMVFLGLSAFGASQSWRQWITGGTLALALLIALFSYFTSHLIEEERLEEELEKLREQLARACSDAAARYQTAVLGQVQEQLEELRVQAKMRIDAETAMIRSVRTLSSQLPLKSTLTALRSEVMRELAGTQGPAALKLQIAQAIGQGGTLRAAIND